MAENLPEIVIKCRMTCRGFSSIEELRDAINFGDSAHYFSFAKDGDMHLMLVRRKYNGERREGESKW